MKRLAFRRKKQHLVIEVLGCCIVIQAFAVVLPGTDAYTLLPLNHERHLRICREQFQVIEDQEHQCC